MYFNEIKGPATNRQAGSADPNFECRRREVAKPIPSARGCSPATRVQIPPSAPSKAPVEAATSPRAVIATAEAMETPNHIMGFLAVDLKEIHSDLPFLPDRM